MYWQCNNRHMLLLKRWQKVPLFWIPTHPVALYKEAWLTSNTRVSRHETSIGIRSKQPQSLLHAYKTLPPDAGNGWLASPANQMTFNLTRTKAATKWLSSAAINVTWTKICSQNPLLPSNSTGKKQGSLFAMIHACLHSCLLHLLLLILHHSTPVCAIFICIIRDGGSQVWDTPQNIGILHPGAPQMVPQAVCVA